MDEVLEYHVLTKRWRPELIALSFIVSFLGAYTTTQLATQTSSTRRTGKALFWIFWSAVSFGGTGIWCMHFVAMLAVDIGLERDYELVLTMVTACIAIGGTFLTLLMNIEPPQRRSNSSASTWWHNLHYWTSATFWRQKLGSGRRISLSYESLDGIERGCDGSELSHQHEERSSTLESDSIHREFDLREALVTQNAGSRTFPSFRDLVLSLYEGCTVRVLVSGALLGFGVFSMHYLGMHAMKFDGRMRYNKFLVLLSYLEAWFTCVVALIYMPVEIDIRRQTIFSLVAAVAVSGLHYIGMLATTFETTLKPPFGSAEVNYALAASCATIAMLTCFISYAFLAHAVSYHKIRLQGYIQTRKELWQANAERRAFERSNRLKSDFIATASHELRTPLYSISGYSELLQTTTLSSEQAAYVDLIKSATKALSLITDSVLDFSKLENDNLESQAKPTRVEIRKLISDCVRQCYMRKDHRSAGVTLLCIIEDRVPETCWIDEVYISRVVFNLCGNALKFTSTGYVMIKLSLGENPHDLMLQCIDTGIGIPQSSLQDIFKPFRQVDSTLQRKFHGTGLGLSISLQLMEKLGGTMAIKSSQEEDDDERGSCFTCLFPNAQSGDDQVAFDARDQVLRAAQKSQEENLNKTTLYLLNRHKQVHPVIQQSFESRFSVRSVNLSKISSIRNTSGQRMLLEVEAFADPGFREYFKSASASNIFFICYDEDAATDQTVSTLELQQMSNVVLLRRPICIDEIFLSDLENMQGGDVVRARAAINCSMAERVDPVLPVTRDRARDDSSHPKGPSVKFSFPPESMDAFDCVESEPRHDDTKGLLFVPGPIQSPLISSSNEPPSEICILLVEDNKVNSKLGMTMLKKCNYMAVAAENGQEAIDLIFADPNRFSLVLMDCQMPVMDGFTATRRIRHWEAERADGRRLPIVALTANVSEAAKQECLEAGADKFLPKPLTMKKLREELVIWLNCV